MTFTIEIGSILTAIVGGLFLLVIRAGVDRLSVIRDHLAKLNGSVLELKTWTSGHDDLDTARFDGQQAQINQLAQLIRNSHRGDSS